MPEMDELAQVQADYAHDLQVEAIKRAIKEPRYEKDLRVCIGGIGIQGPCFGHGPSSDCPYCIVVPSLLVYQEQEKEKKMKTYRLTTWDKDSETGSRSVLDIREFTVEKPMMAEKRLGLFLLTDISLKSRNAVDFTLELIEKEETEAHE